MFAEYVKAFSFSLHVSRTCEGFWSAESRDRYLVPTLVQNESTGDARYCASISNKRTQARLSASPETIIGSFSSAGHLPHKPEI
jgi:hypothetical protein